MERAGRLRQKYLMTQMPIDRHILHGLQSRTIGTRIDAIGFGLTTGRFIEHPRNVRTEQQTNARNSEVNEHGTHNLGTVRGWHQIAKTSRRQRDHRKVDAIQGRPAFLHAEYVQGRHDVDAEVECDVTRRTFELAWGAGNGEELSLPRLAVGTHVCGMPVAIIFNGGRHRSKPLSIGSMKLFVEIRKWRPAENPTAALHVRLVFLHGTVPEVTVRAGAVTLYFIVAFAACVRMLRIAELAGHWRPERRHFLRGAGRFRFQRVLALLLLLLSRQP
mmetsp:Transcript_15242/g.42986  ORF Transcript_15242/g.42986 Transcript_15242/m.42986 type:complete len:274 (-) Transcript_15242:401-1222(-)